jgi:hypothetical protein
MKTEPDYANLTESDLLTNSGELVVQAIANKKFEKIPKRIITESVLIQQAMQPPQDIQKGHRIIHLIALQKEGANPQKIPPINHIPKEILTHKVLSSATNKGETVYHILASLLALETLPPKLITKESLLLSTKDKRTVLHSVAINCPHFIPHDITLKELLVEDENQFTPLHAWACSNTNVDNTGGWAGIPKKFLTKETINIEDAKGKTPLDYMLEEFNFDVTYRDRKSNPKAISQIKHILSLLSQQSLENIVNTKRINNVVLEKLINHEQVLRKFSKELLAKEQGIEI